MLTLFILISQVNNLILLMKRHLPGFKETLIVRFRIPNEIKIMRKIYETNNNVTGDPANEISGCLY
jgi:hypothetical protein